VVLLVLAWCSVVLPRLVQSLTVDKRRTTVDDPLPYSAPGLLTDRLMQLALMVACVVVVARSVRSLPASRRRALVLLLAPWFYLVLRDLYEGQALARTSQLLFPAVVVALWVARASLQHLKVLGYLHGVLVVLSLALAIFLPEKGIYQAAGGGAVAPAKEILPIGILIGPFTDGNNCAQVLLLGLPAVAFLPRPGARRLIVLLTSFALVWTSARSALVGLVVAGAVLVALRLVRPAGRGPLSAAVLVSGCLALVALPLLTTSSTAFTNRGFIWQESLRAWSESPLFGLGSGFYSAVARFANPLDGFAFHGHNQAVQVLVTMGLLGAGLVGALYLLLVRRAAGWATRGVSQPTVFLSALLVSGSQEVSFGFVDRNFMLAVAILPVAVLALSTPTPPGVVLHGGEDADASTDEAADEEVEARIQPECERRHLSASDGHHPYRP
jgi:O-antigen ligase